MLTKFMPDNPLLRLEFSLADLSCFGSVKSNAEIKPENMPFLIGVEAVREKNASESSPQTASRYNLVFPGSGFMRIAVKVEETTPSITSEAIEKCGGIVRVNIEGFTGGVFEVDGGGVRPYFTAPRIRRMDAVRDAIVDFVTR